MLRILFAPNFTDHLCMIVILCEDNCLTKVFAEINPLTVLNQSTQCFFDRILVEDPFVQRARLDAFRNVAAFVRKRVLIFLLFFRREIRVTSINSTLRKDSEKNNFETAT